jgi:hypothetical protein
VGSKTGWTYAAGNTLVTYAESDGRRLIVTILQGTGTAPFTYTTALLDYAFALPYEERVVFNASSYVRVVPVHQEIGGERVEVQRLALQAEQDLVHSLPLNFDLSRLRYDLDVPESLTAPVAEGEPLGSVAVYAQNVRLGTVALLAQNRVDETEPGAPETEYAFAPQVPAYDGAAPPEEPPAAPQEAAVAAPELLRTEDRLAAMAVPLTVSFIGLILSALIFATRRRRRMRKLFYAGGAKGSGYTGYSGPYRYR